MKCSPSKKENFSVICKRNSKSINKSISVFSTQIETPIKEEYVENCDDLSQFFQKWKNFLVNKKLAWEILFPEFRKLMKKNKKILEYCWKNREKFVKRMCFYGIKRNQQERKSFKPVFIKKFLKVWKKFVRVVKQGYAGTYIIQEKQCTRIEKHMLGVWKKKFEQKRKINSFIMKKNSKLQRKYYQSLKNISQSHKKSKTIIKICFTNKLKSLKSQYFWNWFKNTQKTKNFFLKSQFSNYEQKINTLESQLLSTFQDLANERKLSSSRDTELKSLLKLHADTLYKSLCES